MLISFLRWTKWLEDQPRKLDSNFAAFTDASLIKMRFVLHVLTQNETTQTIYLYRSESISFISRALKDLRSSFSSDQVFAPIKFLLRSSFCSDQVLAAYVYKTNSPSSYPLD